MTLRTTELAGEALLDGARDSSRPLYELASTDNLDVLLAVLPPRISDAVADAGRRCGYDNLVEIVMDLGRIPEARFQTGEVPLTHREIDREDLAFVAERIGAFGGDNRAGIERTLHRISAIRNRSGEIVGLTCRVGRAVFGTIAIMRDLIETGQSVLLLGRPEWARPRCYGKRLACLPTSCTSAWWSSTHPMRLPVMAIFLTRPSDEPGACRCQLRQISTAL